MITHWGRYILGCDLYFPGIIIEIFSDDVDIKPRILDLLNLRKR